MENHTSRLRWLMIAMVFIATTINYLDRQTLSIVAPVLREQFQFGDVAYSRIVAAFLLAYTLANGFSGVILDRLGTRLGYALCVAWWSIAAALHAVAQGPISFGVCRFLLGIGEAGNWPAGVKVATEWFVPKERALASGIFNSGSSIGAAIAPPLVAFIVLRSGWRAAFLIIGSTGLVWLAIWWRLYRTPEPSQFELEGKPVAALTLMRTRVMWLLTVAKFQLDPVWYFYIFWFPQYLHSVRGFDLAAIGKYAWIPFVTADVGNVAGGWVSAMLIRGGITPVNPRKLAVLIFGALMMSAIPAVLVKSAVVSVWCVALATMGYTGALANLLAFPGDIFPKSAVASVWGLASMGSGIGGMLVSLGTGWAIGRYSYTVVFCVMGVLPLLSALTFCAIPNRRVLFEARASSEPGVARQIG